MEDNQSRGGGVGGVVGAILNLLTIGIVLATIAVGVGFAAVFLNPSLIDMVNPYLPVKLAPAPTLPPTLGPPTATDTPAVYLGATWTTTATLTSTPSPTATETLVPTDTPTATLPAATPSPSGMPFSLQPDSPKYTTNFANTKGCQWMGVAGQAFDNKSSAPIAGLAVRLGGQLSSLPFDLTSLTGSAPAYGPGGYEFVLSDHPIASNKTLWIQLLDTAGVALSDKIYFTTSDKCNENLVLIHWLQVR
jgi:hypothetical protein